MAPFLVSRGSNFTRCLGRLLAVMFLLPMGITALSIVGDAAEDKAATTVTLIIDYGDGVEKRFKNVPWKSDMTVSDLMTHARQHPRGIKLDIKGSSATALLTRVDDLENQGGSGLNWVYRVNEKLGDRSFAVFKLKANDTVLWRFEEYR